MADQLLEKYLDDMDAAPASLLRALDRAITTAQPDFDVAIKYRILMYAFHRDWRHWVCAINASRDGVCLRFLYGVLLDDPRGLLRPGTSTLMTWDFKLNEAIDSTAVGSYVTEAVQKYDYYKANARQITETSRAAARDRGRPERSH